MKENNIEGDFFLPNRELKSLSFIKPDKVSIDKWVAELPLTDSIKSIRMLYVVIKEICEFQTSASNRLLLIDALRPSVHLVSQGLKKSYLRQPIILPDEAQKVANLCYGVQAFLAKAYLICACQCVEKMDRSFFKKPTQMIAQCIYLNIIESTDLLIRNALLYRPTPDMFWISLHRLYSLAIKYNLLHIPQINADYKNSASSIEHAYMHLLMWGFINTNQLKQEDIEQLEKHVWELARYLKFGMVDRDQEAQIILDPTSDVPPLNQKYYKGDYSSSCQSLRVDELVEKLDQLLTPLAQKQASISPYLVKFLHSTWASFLYRTSVRQSCNMKVTLGLGLATSHYYLGDNKPFTQYTYSDGSSFKNEDNSSQFKAKLSREQSLDSWDQSLHGTSTKSAAQLGMEDIDFQNKLAAKTSSGTAEVIKQDEKSTQEKYSAYHVDMLNMSPGGYCLEWLKNSPNAIKPGEIIAIKEEQRNSWNLGSIRWVRQSKERSIHIGVELLSPTATAFGARICDFEGNAKSDFMRVLLLPEIKGIQRPSTIITPALTFISGQHVLLTRDGHEQTIELKKLLSSTGSYSQFAYVVVKESAPVQMVGKNLDASGNEISTEKVAEAGLFSNWDVM